MFKSNPDSMRMEPTPERVLAVCRTVAQESISREDLRNLLTLGLAGDKEVDEINKSIAVAQDELGLIQQKDNKLVFVGPQSAIDTTKAFRQYVSSMVFSRKDSTFVMFTRWLIAKNDSLFAMQKWENMAEACSKEVSELSAVNENSVLGWRFWAAFLGLGYLNGTMILPNLKTRIQDILATSYDKSFRYGDTVRATDFILWLSNKLPEADLSGKLPLAVSAGLRTLHELGFIKLETWQDSNRVMLFYVDGERINEFSHITVWEEVCT